MAAALKGTVLVTGANGGLGSGIAHQIVHSTEFSSYYGVYTVRDPANATALGAELKSGTAHQHEMVALDLGKLDVVRSVAAHVNVSTYRLHHVHTWVDLLPDAYVVSA